MQSILLWKSRKRNVRSALSLRSTHCYVCFTTRREAGARPGGSTERAREREKKRKKEKQPRSRSDSSELSTSTHRASTAVAAAATAAAMDSTSLVSLSAASFTAPQGPGDPTCPVRARWDCCIHGSLYGVLFFILLLFLIARGTFVAFRCSSFSAG